jgi:hypothetical protein
MAPTRSYNPILEQSRHFWIALSAAIVLLVAVSGFFLGRESPPVASDTFPISPVQGRVIVEVLNGTQRQGAARTATRMLRGRGIDVVFLGNADSAEGATRVIVRRGELDRARYVAGVLGAGKVVVEPDTFRRVDVSVILGDDFKPKLELHP